MVSALRILRRSTRTHTQQFVKILHLSPPIRPRTGKQKPRSISHPNSLWLSARSAFKPRSKHSRPQEVQRQTKRTRTSRLLYSLPSHASIITCPYTCTVSYDTKDRSCLCDTPSFSFHDLYRFCISAKFILSVIYRFGSERRMIISTHCINVISPILDGV